MWLIGLALCLGVTNAIDGYPRQSLMFGGRSTVAWELVGTTQIRFAWTADIKNGWSALGFSTGGMKGDVVIMESDGLKINPYSVAGQGITPTLKTGAYFTNASVTVDGTTMIGRFTRTRAAPSSGSVTINPASVSFMYGYCSGPWPSQHDYREIGSLDLTGTGAPTSPYTPSPTGTAPPTPYVATALFDFQNNITVLQGKVNVAWTIVSNGNVRFGLQSQGAQWVAIGFQDPAASQKMTGDVIVVHPTNTIGAFRASYGIAPTDPIPGNYFVSASGARTGNLLYGIFTRSLAAPLNGTVNISNINLVRLMVAYSTNTFPQQHQGRVEVLIDLQNGLVGTEPAAPPSPSPSGVANSGAVVSYLQALTISTMLGLML